MMAQWQRVIVDGAQIEENTSLVLDGAWILNSMYAVVVANI